jgi:hypothetical protein
MLAARSPGVDAAFMPFRLAAAWFVSVVDQADQRPYTALLVLQSP